MAEYHKRETVRVVKTIHEVKLRESYDTGYGVKYALANVPDGARLFDAGFDKEGEGVILRFEVETRES